MTARLYEVDLPCPQCGTLVAHDIYRQYGCHGAVIRVKCRNCRTTVKASRFIKTIIEQAETDDVH